VSLLATTLDGPEGRRVRVAELGAGEPVILLHGYPDTLQGWSAVAPLLAQRLRVVAFDWPGMGRSDAWPGGMTPQAQADRLAALMDRWAIDSAHVVGIDMGGQPALAFAARHPARLLRLAVMNSLVLGDERTSWEIRVLRRFGWNRALLRHLPRAVFERALRTSIPRGWRLPDDVRDDFSSCFREGAVREVIVRACAGYQGALPALPELYERIAHPTLVLWGARDRHFPPAQAERLAKLVPGARLEIIEGGEHWMPLHAPEEVAARLLTFLA
jgi:pimeloyl-ACP methyl ester carboxylesterase